LGTAPEADLDWKRSAGCLVRVSSARKYAFEVEASKPDVEKHESIEFLPPCKIRLVSVFFLLVGESSDNIPCFVLFGK